MSTKAEVVAFLNKNFEYEGEGEWLVFGDARWADGTTGWDNRIGSIVYDGKGKWNIHDMHSGDGPWATHAQVLKYVKVS